MIQKPKPQLVQPRWFVAQMAKLECPMSTVGILLGRSDAVLSLWVSQEQLFTIEAQILLLLVVEFVIDLRIQYEPAPINFSDAAALRPLFLAFLRRRAADGVVGPGVLQDAMQPQATTA